jgi:hypothetical protein
MGVEVGRFRFDGLPSRRYARDSSVHKRTRESTTRSTPSLLLLTVIVTLDDALGEL